MNRKIRTAISWATGFLLIAVTGLAQNVSISLKATGEETLPGWVEIIGVEAGAFDPAIWENGTFNLVPDVRFPMIEPLTGAYRNIYAPSVVEIPDGWRIFFGAWDGVPTPNDRIYSVTSRDFLSFENRHKVIEHNKFVHVCNVNALRLDDGSFSMVCTVYPDSRGLNKPAFFHSPDGQTWNDSPAPYPARLEDIVNIQGYGKFADADINGMNVLLFEDGKYRLYFGNFRDFNQVYRASGTDGKTYQFEAPVLQGSYAVNDVKKFRVGKHDWYLMGLHLNGDRTWYSLSRDGLQFPTPRELFTNLSPADRYIVALGWVVQGKYQDSARRLLGVLYGAGHDSGLASNRIFAHWLQRKIVWVPASGQRSEGQKARGPSRQLLPLSASDGIEGRVELYAEDGKTLIGRSTSLKLESGKVYQLQMRSFGKAKDKHK